MKIDQFFFFVHSQKLLNKVTQGREREREKERKREREKERKRRNEINFHSSNLMYLSDK